MGDLDIPKPSGPSPILIILQVSSLRYNESSGNLKQEENGIIYITHTHTDTQPLPHLPTSLQSMTIEMSSSTIDSEKKLSSDDDLQ